MAASLEQFEDFLSLELFGGRAAGTQDPQVENIEAHETEGEARKAAAQQHQTHYDRHHVPELRRPALQLCEGQDGPGCMCEVVVVQD